MSMSWLTPSRAVEKKATSRPAFDQTAPPFTDRPSVSIRGGAAPVV